MTSTSAEAVRNVAGRFVASRCPDPRCDGRLRREGDQYRCDGLTHVDDHGPLHACRVGLDPACDEVPS